MELPNEVPVMTLPNATLFPQALLPLYICEPRYRQMLRDALNSSRMFAVAMRKPGRSRETPVSVAGLGIIRASVRQHDGTSRLILQGVARVELGAPVRHKPYRVHRIRPLAAPQVDSVVIDALVAKVHELVEQRIKLGFNLLFPLMQQTKIKIGSSMPAGITVRDVINYLENLPDVEQIVDLVSHTLLNKARERQAILETVDVETRLRHLIHFLLAEIRRTRKNAHT